MDVKRALTAAVTTIAVSREYGFLDRLVGRTAAIQA